MNSQVQEKILEQLSGIIETAGFSPNEDKTQYQNDRMAFKIGHDEEKNLLMLDVAEVNEMGEVGEFSNASSWLFENPEDLRDAESAGLDFLDTLKGKLGIKNTRTNRNGEIAMPSKEKSGGSYNIEAFTAKILAVYPQFKEEYKEHIAHFGTFLYIDFFKSTLMPKVEEILTENNKKSVKKIVTVLDELYVGGDRMVQNVILGVVLCGAVKDNQTLYDTVLESLADSQFLKNAFVSIMERFKKDKKFREVILN